MADRTVSHPLKARWLVGSWLLWMLAAAAVPAQDPPRRPVRPDGPDHARPERGERRDGDRAERQRAAPTPAHRLDQLEAKLDTLVAEVRQLRRAINRQRAALERSGRLPARGPGERLRPGFGPLPHGAYGPAGPGTGPAALPFGPGTMSGNMWGTYPPRGSTYGTYPGFPGHPGTNVDQFAPPQPGPPVGFPFGSGPMAPPAGPGTGPMGRQPPFPLGAVPQSERPEPDPDAKSQDTAGDEGGD